MEGNLVRLPLIAVKNEHAIVEVKDSYTDVEEFLNVVYDKFLLEAVESYYKSKPATPSCRDMLNFIDTQVSLSL